MTKSRWRWASRKAASTRSGVSVTDDEGGGPLQGLRELGYVDGESIFIEYRSAAWSRS